METLHATPGNLEIRQEGGLRVMLGTFPYGTLATITDRGAVRKESFLPSALGYSIRDSSARIDFLIGHDWGKPVASRQSGTLKITDSPTAVEFEATLPNPAPSWVVDMERSVQGGIMTGLSPGFRVPPRSAVPNAESIVPEPGNPGVKVRQIRQAVLQEMSVLTSRARIVRPRLNCAAMMTMLISPPVSLKCVTSIWRKAITRCCCPPLQPFGTDMAVTITVDDLRREVRVGDSADETALLTARLAYATEAVTHRVPGAPDIVHNEACIRLSRIPV